MARFTSNDVDKYGGHGGAGFFSLKGDGDSAIVRFLYNDIDDVEGYAVHEVEIDGKKRYVNCLREYNQPVEDCPFCREKRYQVAKLFIPLYNEDEGKIQVWERGKKFFQKISGICSRYNKAPIVSQTFEIVRNGKPGDKQTSYEIYRTDEPADGTKLEDFEMPDILGGTILDKSAEDMEFYLDNEYFPPEEDEAPVRRSRGSEDDRPAPARARRGSEDERPANRRQSSPSMNGYDEDDEDEEYEEERPARRSSGRRTPGRKASDEF